MSKLPIIFNDAPWHEELCGFIMPGYDSTFCLLTLQQWYHDDGDIALFAK